jgi:hypothetical protein
MAASHLVAGENVKDGNHEEADAGGYQHRVEHGIALVAMTTYCIAAKIIAGSYKFAVVRQRDLYKAHISRRFFPDTLERPKERLDCEGAINRRFRR